MQSDLTHFSTLIDGEALFLQPDVCPWNQTVVNVYRQKLLLMTAAVTCHMAWVRRKHSSCGWERCFNLEPPHVRALRTCHVVNRNAHEPEPCYDTYRTRVTWHVHRRFCGWQKTKLITKFVSFLWTCWKPVLVNVTQRQGRGTVTE